VEKPAKSRWDEPSDGVGAEKSASTSCLLYPRMHKDPLPLKFEVIVAKMLLTGGVWRDRVPGRWTELGCKGVVSCGQSDAVRTQSPGVEQSAQSEHNSEGAGGLATGERHTEPSWAAGLWQRPARIRVMCSVSIDDKWR
jgi:hypothetical protein